ncbi:MAG: type II toxin-antitoxin system RelE/ParE family toxin [Pseudomonadota bacterium]
MNYDVYLTELSYKTLATLTRYMKTFLGEEEAIRLGKQLLDFAENKLGDNPLQFPVSHELETLGIVDYRVVLVDNYKILFRLDEKARVSYVMAFLRQKQNTQELLYQITIS